MIFSLFRIFLCLTLPLSFVAILSAEASADDAALKKLQRRVEVLEKQVYHLLHETGSRGSYDSETDDSAIDESPVPEEKDPASDKENGIRCSISKTKLREALSNLPGLLSSARAVPYFRNGQSVGIRFFAIKPESLYVDLKLKNGDILQSIDGRSLAVTDAPGIFHTLDRNGSVLLSVSRGGIDRRYKCTIS